MIGGYKHEFQSAYLIFYLKISQKWLIINLWDTFNQHKTYTPQKCLNNIILSYFIHSLVDMTE